MDYRFTPPADALKPSAIREIFKLTKDPNIIPFSAGNPSPEAFPSKSVAEITNKILADEPIAALQYSITEGYAPLRTLVGEYMKSKYGIGNENDEVLLTAGAQQVMSLAGSALAGAGDTILCEDPSFIGSLNALRLTGAKMVGIPMEADGLSLSALENALKTEKNVRLLYIIPNFQNPTGFTTSLEKRRAILELAKKYNILIVEDNPYGDLYFKEAPPASIKSMDTEGRVIYAGSFSKVISPGLRVGYAIANSELIGKFTAMKQTQDVHTNILAQMICYHFMKDYDYEAHLASLRALYSKKAALANDAAKKYLEPEIEMAEPTGGLFGWCKLPDKIDLNDFCMRAIKECAVAVVPGVTFNVDPKAPSRYFRITYSSPTSEQLVTGLEKLGKLAKSW